MNLEQILNSFMSLMGMRSDTQFKSFRDYPGVTYSGGNLYSAAQKKLTQAFGPIGPIIYRIAFGKQFQGKGSFARKLNDTMFSQGQTALGAMLSIRSRQLASFSQDSYQQAQKQLKQSFYRMYANVMYGDVSKASDFNWLSVPSIIHTLLDPTKAQSTLKFMNLATANAVNWQNRYGGVRSGSNGFINSQQNVRAVSQAVKDIITQAALQELGPSNLNNADTQTSNLRSRKTDWNKFGGYSAQAVSRLAAIVTSQRDFMNAVPEAGDNTQAARSKAKQQIVQTVSDITKALQPLRDVFKGDVLATVDAIKAVSKRAITALSSTQLRQLSQGMVDTMRFTGVTPAVYANTVQAVQKRLLQTAKQNGTGHWAAIQGAAGVTNLTLSGITAIKPFGLSEDVYTHITQQATSSAQMSRYTQRLARIYAIAKQKGNVDNIQQFLKQTGGDASAAMDSFGITQTDLLSAPKSVVYLQALNSGQLAYGALQQQFKVLGSALLDNYNSQPAIRQRVSNIMFDDKNLSFRHRLFTATTDEQIEKVFTDYGMSAQQATQARGLWNQMNSDSRFGQYFKTIGSSATSTAMAMKMRYSQSELRRALQTIRTTTSSTAQLADIISNWNNIGQNDEYKKAAKNAFQTVMIHQGFTRQQLPQLLETADPVILSMAAMGQLDSQNTKSYFQALRSKPQERTKKVQSALDIITGRNQLEDSKTSQEAFQKKLTQINTRNETLKPAIIQFVKQKSPQKRLQLLNNIGQLLRGLGFSQQVASAMFKQIQKLPQAFAGLSDDQIAQAINTGIISDKAFTTAHKKQLQERALAAYTGRQVSDYVDSQDQFKRKAGESARDKMKKAFEVYQGSAKGKQDQLQLAKTRRDIIRTMYKEGARQYAVLNTDDLADDATVFKQTNKVLKGINRQQSGHIKLAMDALTDTNKDNDADALKTLRRSLGLEGSANDKAWKTVEDQIKAKAASVRRAQKQGPLTTQNVMMQLLQGITQLITNLDKQTVSIDQLLKRYPASR